MRAAVYREYGAPSVVKIEELPKPEPRDNELLIRVHASTVSSADWRARSLVMPAGFGPFARPVFGMFGPRKRVLGTELAGEIEAVGKAVSKWQVGDRVFAFPGFDLGCHVEYRTMPEDGRVALMPVGLSFEEAASLSFGGSTVLHFLRNAAKVQPGEEVLVIGASGTVGSAAVQLARHFGARVTGLTSGSNLALVSKLGAARVIDYTTTSFLDDSARYDIILDTVGVTTFSACAHVLKENGRLLLCAASLPQILGSSWSAIGSKKHVIVGSGSECVEHLQALKALVEAGGFRPLVDRSYSLSQIVEAHSYVDTGRKRGSVVITMD